jgi:hypothetical protein
MALSLGFPDAIYALGGAEREARAGGAASAGCAIAITPAYASCFCPSAVACDMCAVVWESACFSHVIAALLQAAREAMCAMFGYPPPPLPVRHMHSPPKESSSPAQSQAVRAPLTLVSHVHSQLRDFLTSPRVSQDMKFSKKDREHVHHVCEALALTGLHLQHVSSGKGTTRILHVTKPAAGTYMLCARGSCTVVRMAEGHAECHAAACLCPPPTPPGRCAASASSHSTPPPAKRPRLDSWSSMDTSPMARALGSGGASQSNTPARVMAREAALRRQSAAFEALAARSSRMSTGISDASDAMLIGDVRKQRPPGSHADEGAEQDTLDAGDDEARQLEWAMRESVQAAGGGRDLVVLDDEVCKWTGSVFVTARRRASSARGVAVGTCR